LDLKPLIKALRENTAAVKTNTKIALAVLQFSKNQVKKNTSLLKNTAELIDAVNKVSKEAEE
jgi:hypothetical protein